MSFSVHQLSRELGQEFGLGPHCPWGTPPPYSLLFTSLLVPPPPSCFGQPGAVRECRKCNWKGFLAFLFFHLPVHLQTISLFGKKVGISEEKQRAEIIEYSYKLPHLVSFLLVLHGGRGWVGFLGIHAAPKATPASPLACSPLGSQSRPMGQPSLAPSPSPQHTRIRAAFVFNLALGRGAKVLLTQWEKAGGAGELQSRDGGAFISRRCASPTAARLPFAIPAEATFEGRQAWLGKQLLHPRAYPEAGGAGVGLWHIPASR